MGHSEESPGGGGAGPVVHSSPQTGSRVSVT